MKIHLSLLLMLTVWQSLAQSTPPHSFSIGLKNGAATVTYAELNTAHLGLVMDHQRNFNAVFSLRTSLHFSHFLPAKLVTHDPRDHNETEWKTRGISRYTFYQASLRLMPCFYHRDENFNLFLGVAGGIGNFWEIRRSFDEYYIVSEEKYELRKRSHRQNSNLQLGYSPVFGLSFNLGPQREGGEIEVSVAYEDWYENIGDWKFSNTDGGYTGFALTTSYRYNFKY